MPSSDSAPSEPARTVFDRETTLEQFSLSQAALIRYLQKPLGATAADAEDVVAELFHNLLEAAAAGTPFVAIANPNEYLRTMAENGLNMMRRRKRAVDEPSPLYIDPSQRRGESILVAREKLEKVRARWNQLSEKERTLLTLVDEEGLGIKEAGARMGLENKDATTTYERAHRELEEELGKNWSTFILRATGDTYKPRTREGMLRLMGNLPREYREVLGLSLVEGLPEGEAARRLNLPSETLQRTLESGLRHLLNMSGMTMDEIQAALRNSLRR
jgi:RNA polymerase sigma factor (sigma-70 family)